MSEGRHTAVFLAEDRELAQRVALKIPRDDGTAMGERLAQEHAALERVTHPNVLRALAHGETGGVPFLATQFHEGTSLMDVISAHAPLPEAWVRGVIAQLLAALGAVHASGLVHGDVTPANCLCVGFDTVESTPQICLLDFGAARLTSATASSPGAGTPAYMAPEQAQSGAPTVESDLYSVAVVAYEMLVGVPPFRASTTTELLWQHANEPVRRPRELAPHASISAAIERAILRGLQKDPLARFSSAEDFLRALEGGDDTSGDAHATRSDDRPSQDARAALLARVREHWIEGVLERATEGVILVRQPITWIKPSDAHAPTSIVDAYVRAPKGLLILADPGHGKTINLLRLARYLGDRATDAEGKLSALPVVFTLSSWRADDRDLAAWMERELVAKYLITAHDGSRLLAEAAIVPLLDGLDDVALASRHACIAAIDAFIARGASPGLVITCRTDDYCNFPRPPAIGSIVRLAPLATDDVVRQLRSASQTSLVEAIRDNAVLGELSHTPMLLHVMRLAFRDSFSFRGALGDQEAAVAQLFDAFLASVLRRGKVDAQKADAPAIANVARLMKRTARTVLLLEDVQPTWLTSTSDRVLYAFLSRAAVAFVFCASLVLAVAFSPLENQGFHTTPGFALRLAFAGTVVLTAVFGLRAARSLSNPEADRAARWPVVSSLALGVVSGIAIGAIVYASDHHPTAFVMGVETGIVGGAVLGISRRKCAGTTRDVMTVERVAWSWRHIDVRLLGALGVVVAIAFASAWALDRPRTAAYIALAMFVLGVGVLGHRAQNLTMRITPNIGIWRSAQNALLVGATALVATTLLFTTSYGLAYSPCVGLTLGVMMALWFGGIDVIHHAVLRGLLHVRGTFGVGAVRMLDAGVELGLLRRAGNGYMFMHAMLLRHMAERR